jgi:hypothetical protein
VSKSGQNSNRVPVAYRDQAYLYERRNEEREIERLETKGKEIVAEIMVCNECLAKMKS